MQAGGEPLQCLPRVFHGVGAAPEAYRLEEGGDDAREDRGLELCLLYAIKEVIRFPTILTIYFLYGIDRLVYTHIYIYIALYMV